MAPLTFVNPGLLAGAAAVAVPIILHLWRRRRPRRLPFSDLRFLEEEQTRRARQLGLQRWLLLLLRVLALLCVVLGVARPRLPGLARAADGAVSAVFILDASASMQTQLDGGTRFDAAVLACAELAAALPPGSEVQVVRAGDSAASLLGEWTAAPLALDPVLAGTTAGEGGCDLPAALREAVRWCRQARRQPADIFLLSDLQRGAVDAGALRAALAELAAAGRPRLLLHRVGEQVPNGGVRAVRLPLRALRAGETFALAAEVRQERAGEVFALELGGQRVAEAVALGQEGAVSEVVFSVAAPAAGRHRGRVVKRSDRLPVDDDFPFVLAVRERVAVLLLHGAERGEAGGRGGWRRLAAALDPLAVATGEGQAPGDGLFAVRALPAGLLTDGDLAAADVALLVDPLPLGRQQLGALVGWLEGGGAAVFWLGDPEQSAELARDLLPALALPGRADFRARAPASQERTRLLAPGHPAFQGFGDEPLATLADIGYRRFHALDAGEHQAPLVFSGGAPALIEARRGAGVFCVFPFNLTLEASDLPLSPMFLPLVQRLVAALAAPTGAGAVPVGAPLQLRAGRAVAASGRLADAGALRLAPPGGGALLPARLSWSGGTPWLTAGIAERKGFHVFLAGPDTVGLLAAAPPAAEGDPELMQPGEMLSLLREAGLGEGRALDDATAAAFAAALAGRELGAWLLLLACALLLVESAVARGSGKDESGSAAP